MSRLVASVLIALTLWATPALAVTIGVSLSSDSNPFYIAMRKGIETRAKELGWSTRFVSANDSVAAQISGVEDLVAQGVDGILISPIDTVASRPAYAAAAAAGIPIMSIARSADGSAQTAAIGMNEVQIGHDIGHWLAEATGGKGAVGMIAGPSGSETFRNLADGFTAEIAKAPDMKIVFRKDTTLSREEGLRIAQDLLVAHPEVKAIYAGNDELALGAIQAVAAAGKTGSVIVTGMNGVPPAVAAVKRGELGLTVDLNPVKWGILGVDTMASWLKGDHAIKKVYIKHLLITK
jgi:ribose transport system substrate-binding protein